MQRLIRRGPSPVSSFSESRHSSFLERDTFYMDADLEGDERAEGKNVDPRRQGDDGRLAGGLNSLLVHIDPLDFAAAEGVDEDGDSNVSEHVGDGQGKGRDGERNGRAIVDSDDEGAQRRPSEQQRQQVEGGGGGEADLAGHMNLGSSSPITATTRPATSLSTGSHDPTMPSLARLGVSSFHCKLISVLEDDVMKQVAQLESEGSSGGGGGGAALRKALEKHAQTCEASTIVQLPNALPISYPLPTRDRKR